MIKDFFNTAFTVKRSVWAVDGFGNNYSEEQNLVNFSGHIQQAQAELVQNLGLSFTKAFTVWCPINTDVKEGDTIISGTTHYSVKAKQVNNVGDNVHTMLIVELDEVPAIAP